MNPLLGGALGSNIAEKKRFQALVWRSHTLSVATPDHGVRDSASTTNLAARNFRGSKPIRENREYYAPRKFGAIR